MFRTIIISLGYIYFIFYIFVNVLMVIYQLIKELQRKYLKILMFYIQKFVHKLNTYLF